eukprot:CAMPEP_0174710154 /NCGR_PEP_ID=MMETSP1094-20130205/11866_1 /TAXON_ID=156173 /ORGANISM="Chrysochromulina brevifilum, Strain UTEX LB 985" /LENGTH=627 /DNA_ID=CAMNT_0015908917 /DNA_START=79 /DNA_END=1962 /DNA_ORIENTATION=+
MRREVKANTLFWVAIGCNVVMICEFCVRFNTAYREPRAKGGRWVTNRRSIFMHYLKTWLLIDLISIIPFDLPFAMGVASEEEFTQTIKVLSLLRLLRILKLGRVMPILLNIMTNRLRFTSSATQVIKFGIFLVLLVHYLACVWAFTGLNWVPSADSSAAFEKPWIEYYGMQDYGIHRLYAVSVYVAIVAIFGGVSSISPQNFVEYIVLTLMMFVGGLVWAYVLSMLCSIFSKLDPRETDFINMMDELGSFMEDKNFDAKHQRRLREYFLFTKDFFALESGYADLFNRMSSKLRADTALIISDSTLSKVWYLSPDKCEKGFLCEVALSMQSTAYELQEPIPLAVLTIIRTGLVAKRMKILGPGSVVGADCVISETHAGLRDDDPCTSISYVTAQCIKRETIFTLASKYPGAAVSLRKAQWHMTTRQALLVFYRKYVKLNRKLPGRMEEVVADKLALGESGKTHTNMRAAKADGSAANAPPGTAIEERLDELTKIVKSLAAAFDGRELGREVGLRGGGVKAPLAERRGREAPGRSFSRARQPSQPTHQTSSVDREAGTFKLARTRTGSMRKSSHSMSRRSLSPAPGSSSPRAERSIHQSRGRSRANRGRSPSPATLQPREDDSDLELNA